MRLDHKNHFETKWLAQKLKEKWLEHGGSRTQWLKDIGFSERGSNGAVHVSYLFSAKRGLTFVKAMRLATLAGVDVSELQRRLVKLEGWPDRMQMVDGNLKGEE